MQKLTNYPLSKLLQYSLTLLALCALTLTSAGCGKDKATPTPEPTAPAESAPEPTAPAKDALPYQDATLPVEERVDDLLSRMTLEEKIGQMTQVEKNSIKKDDITERFIGSLLSGGGGYPKDNNTPQGWAEMVNEFQSHALGTRLGIPLLYGVDAVHGHNNVEGAVIFPHNVGLGATRDPDLMRRIGQVTALEVAATSVHWNFGPCVAVPQDIRWGRTYEGYSENTELVGELAAAYIQGLQGDDLANPTTILATAKHFVGDGGTAWGTGSGDYEIDQGVTTVDEATLRAVHLPPYIAAIEAGAESVMVSFSSWGGMKMHAQKYLISDVLKSEMGFEGFVVSDWAGIDQITSDYYDAVVAAINAGIDMNMVPYDYDRYIVTLIKAVESGDVPLERVDDAVRRILRVKFELGLFERPYADESLLETIGADEHRALAREAVQKSLVLLKNDGALPIAQDAPLIFVAGAAADDVGVQSGGWTIEWQGLSGDITGGTTILEAIQNTVSGDTTVEFNRFGKFDQILDDNGDPAMADVGIVVVGERPYAEGRGDSYDLALSDSDIETIARARGRSSRLVVVLISGRPMIISEQIPLADAFVAAWLPGTEGQGVADALFGDAPFSGKLAFTWPRTMDQIPFDFGDLPTEGCEAPLFPFGYGLDVDSPAPPELDNCLRSAKEILAELVIDDAEPVQPKHGGPVLDDFEIGELPTGKDDYADIGYITWSDGSPVSIQTVEVDAGDELALPGQSGANTILQLDTDVQGGGWGGFTNAFANEALDQWITQDWSAYEGIAMWVYGNGSGGTLFVDIQDNRNPDSKSDDAERWSYDILDDFEGWQYVAMPFSAFRRKEIGNGAPNDGLTLTEVHGYALGAFGSAPMGQQTNYVDQVVLYGEAEVRPLEIKFAKAQYSAKEGGVATVRLQLNKPAAETITVQYTTLEGDAALDRDYVLPGDTVVFEKGMMEQAIKISAIDDALAEGKEQTLLALYNPTGAILNPQARAILTIRDNDSRDPNRLLDLDEAPPFIATENVTLSILEVAAGAELAQPEQSDYESVLAVDYHGAGSFGHTFGEGQDWSGYTGLSFWYYGQGSGETITLELLDNQASTTADVDPGDWELVWSDEFDGPAGAPPDPGVWKPEVGDGLMNGIPGWGNAELEYYTASTDNAASDGEGNLVLTARELDETSTLRCWYGPCRYTSARLITWERLEFAFGRAEARLKLPFGQGLWPAFWMLGTNLDEVGWPQAGEVDIMEYVGKEPMTVYGAIHGPGYSGADNIGGDHVLDAPVADDFHVFAIEWTPDQIHWFVDDVNFFSATPDAIPGGTEWAYNHPFFLLLNVAVGGNWPGDPDDTTTFPQTMIVDYVRVYRAANASERFEHTFSDDAGGWQQVVLPFNAFGRSANQPDGAPDDGLNLTEVWGYSFNLPDGGSGPFYLDRVGFETGMP